MSTAKDWEYCLLTATAKTATFSTSGVRVPERYKDFLLIVRMSAEVGAMTVTVKPQVSIDGTNYADCTAEGSSASIALGAMTGVGNKSLFFKSCPQKIRAYATLSGTTSATLSIWIRSHGRT